MAIDPDHAVQVQRAVETQLPKVVPASDAGRMEGLNATIAFQAARSTALSIGRARAAAKYGAGSDQVRGYDAKITIATATTTGLQVAREKSTAQAPSLPANAAGVFGRVVGPDGIGIVGALIEALDPNGKPVQRAASRDGGAWQLVLEAPPSPPAPKSASTDSQPDRTTLAAATDGPTLTAAAAGPGATAAAGAMAIRLRAQATGWATLTATETLTLHAGDVVFRLLTMQPQSSPVVPPRTKG